jgi:aminomethyltransferase
MGNLLPPLERAFSNDAMDDYIHLQPLLQELHLRADAQSVQIFQLEAGDRILLDLPDQQSTDLLIWNSELQLQPDLLIQEQHAPSAWINNGAAACFAHLAKSWATAVRLQQQLTHHGIDHDVLKQALTLEHSGKYNFQATAALCLAVLNTGLDMDVTQQQCCVEEIKITMIKAVPLTHYLPPPLAAPIQEILVPRATARSYHVKAGQWIQIIDLSGKQCSDFLAFDEQALKAGEEIGLDAAATRTILGHSVPSPGLHAKFYGTDMKALAETVQDTVGRHDMFLNACSPKFYNDSGYFGHISCTDNFNQILKPYGIASRASWPAINLFYNTFAEATGAISMAEPWSKPGDFVLLRASRDLLCASSACPDDIDPSNGWVPTDIFVRIYDEDQDFPRSQHYRIDPKEQPRMTQASGFFPRIQALTAKISEYHGFWIANEYDGWGAKAEYLACRERVAMIDLSALRKFEITGPDAEAFMQYALTRNVRKLAVGEIAYSASCLDTGGMVDDGTIFRMGENCFRWICGDEYSGTWLKQLAQQLGYKISIRNSSAHIHNVAVQGPQSRALLEQIIWTPEHQPDLAKLAWFHFTLGKLGGPDGIPLMVSRTGYTGELGFEVWCHPSHAAEVWDAVWHTGQQYGIAPMGFDALDLLRIEAGLIFAQHEFCAETNPYEAGIGFTVPMKTKTEDFIGKQAMQNQAPESRHKLMGLILQGNEAVQHGDPVYAGRFRIGVVTSAANSPLLHQQIAMCRLAPQYAAVGTELEVGQLDGLKKRLKAHVTSLPFYDPERTRVRS